MLQMILGLQGILLFFVAAKLLDNATQIGFFASIIFGGLPALGLMGALLVMFPRSMLVVGTIFWIAAGAGLGSSLGAGGATMAALILVFGGLGFAANFTIASQGLSMERTVATEGPAVAAWKSPTRKQLEEHGYDLDELARGVARLFDAHIIAPTVYGRVTSLLPSHGKVAKVDPTTEEGCDQLYLDLSNLCDQMLLSLEEEADARQTLDALTGPGQDRRMKEFKAAQAAMSKIQTPAASLRPTQIDTSDKSRQAGFLADLVACRALPLDAFARAMLKLDPNYDVRAARIENFPPQPVQPLFADIAHDLYDDAIISLADLQTVLDVVKPREVI